MSQDEVRRKRLKPRKVADVGAVLKRGWGLSLSTGSTPAMLDSYDDRNYVVVDAAGTRYTLKFHNGVDSESQPVLEGQNAAMQFLVARGVECPVPVRTLDGKFLHREDLGVSDGSTASIVVRLLTWVEGVTMQSCAITPPVLLDAGSFLGKIQKAFSGGLSLVDGGGGAGGGGVGGGSGGASGGGDDDAPCTAEVFDHPALHRTHAWDTANTALLKEFTHHVEDLQVRELVEKTVAAFERDVQPDLGLMRKGVLMSDFNDANVILRPTVDGTGLQVGGVIDFGDMVHTCSVFDLTVGMAYAMISSYGKLDRGLACAALLLRGFSRHFPLQPAERKHLRLLTACRLVRREGGGLISGCVIVGMRSCDVFMRTAAFQHRS
jgi:Ser/Thr protein kinase RdoA (MazF antagonist)